MGKFHFAIVRDGTFAMALYGYRFITCASDISSDACSHFFSHRMRMEPRLSTGSGTLSALSCVRRFSVELMISGL